MRYAIIIAALALAAAYLLWRILFAFRAVMQWLFYGARWPDE